MLLLRKFVTCLKIILKVLEITPDNSLVLQFLATIMNLPPTGVFMKFRKSKH